MTLRTFDGSLQAAIGFVTSQTAHIEREVYARQYPGITYPDLIPVDSSASEWAATVTYYSSDVAGRPELVAGSGRDIPLVDTSTAQHETTVAMAAIGYQYTVEEIGRAQMASPARPLDVERAVAARLVYEQYLDATAIEGLPAKGWKGLVNYAGVPKAAAANGAAGTATWATKTAVEVLADVNGALTSVYESSNTVEMADTVLLPVPSFSDLAVRVLTGTSMPVMQFIRENNVYTATTGKPLKIQAVRQLAAAGDGGTRRMVAYRRDPTVLKMHLPMPLRFLAPQAQGLAVVVPGMFRFGGLDIRRPGSMRYVDGI